MTRHEVKDEEPPADRFHEAAFQKAFGDAKALMAGLAGVLGSGALHLEPDSVIKGLRERAGRLARFECPADRVVGLVGDSGVGKWRCSKVAGGEGIRGWANLWYLREE